MLKKIKLIPYGVSDFEDIQLTNKYFVDKTSFIHFLEQHKYIFFIRPRRFGKSLWLSIIESYYDIARKDQFESLFKNTDIGKNPTPEQNSYLIMRFDFSTVNPDIAQVEQSFNTRGNSIIDSFITRYSKWFTEHDLLLIEKEPEFSDKLAQLFVCAGDRGVKIYVLIDEYDNFANTILSTQGTKAYYDLTHGEGFFRHFFSILKGGATRYGAGLSRLFITGVSPVTLDDVTSGFNIGTNLSLYPDFNEMIGFTAQEVRQLLEYYKSVDCFSLDIDQSMELMHKWYNGYFFSRNSDTSVFNSDMVLYFASACNLNHGMPYELIDTNVRIDYGKLKHLMLISRQIKHLNGNFDILKNIIEQGHVESRVNTSFPLEELLDPENFVSLLYYFGLLSFDSTKYGGSVLKIPNLTIQHLMYGYIRGAYKDVDIFRISIWKFEKLIRQMGWIGKWKQVFEFLAQEVKNQTSIHDYLHGEKIIQGFLLAYLNITDIFIPHTEYELNKGYSDFFLEPFKTKYPDMAYGYLIELKYIPRSEKLSEAVLKQTIESAKIQLDKYAKDKQIQNKYKDATIVKLVLVYYGWEMVSASQHY